MSVVTFQSHDWSHTAIIVRQRARLHTDAGKDALSDARQSAVASRRRREDSRRPGCDEGVLGHLQRADHNSLRIVILL